MNKLANIWWPNMTRHSARDSENSQITLCRPCPQGTSEQEGIYNLYSNTRKNVTHTWEISLVFRGEEITLEERIKEGTLVVIAFGQNFKKDLPLTSQQSGVLGRGDAIRKALSAWRLKFFCFFVFSFNRSTGYTSRGDTLDKILWEEGRPELWRKLWSGWRMEPVMRKWISKL